MRNGVLQVDDPPDIESSFRGRRLPSEQSRPRSLDIVGDDNRPVLEWIARAGPIAADKPLYVRLPIEKIIRSSPDLGVRYHQQRDRRSAGALCACAGRRSRAALVSGTWFSRCA